MSTTTTLMFEPDYAIHPGETLAETLEELGMSQAELAQCLKRPQSFVSKYETKQRRLDVVEFLEVAHCLQQSGPQLLALLADGTPEQAGPSRMLGNSERKKNASSTGDDGRGKEDGDGRIPRSRPVMKKRGA